jgi:hypothetical protein
MRVSMGSTCSGNKRVKKALLSEGGKERVADTERVFG